MLKLLLIGIGSGNPEHMTVQAIGALNRADLVLLARKGTKKADLIELRRDICRRFLTNEATRIVEFDLPSRDPDLPYLAAVDAWHAAIARLYRDLLDRELPGGGNAALLVWGDPSLYDSTLRILERLRDEHGLSFEIEMIPGITSVQVLTAAHAIPLNTLAGSVLYTTGRRLREEGVPQGIDTAVVLLDGETSYHALPGEAFDIYWGGYLGLDKEVALSGPLAATAQKIDAARAELRAAHGWIMDVYLLRRRKAAEGA